MGDGTGLGEGGEVREEKMMVAVYTLDGLNEKPLLFRSDGYFFESKGRRQAGTSNSRSYGVGASTNCGPIRRL